MVHTQHMTTIVVIATDSSRLNPLFCPLLYCQLSPLYSLTRWLPQALTTSVVKRTALSRNDPLVSITSI
jgi:hypothetical protein